MSDEPPVEAEEPSESAPSAADGEQVSTPLAKPKSRRRSRTVEPSQGGSATRSPKTGTRPRVRRTVRRRRARPPIGWREWVKVIGLDGEVSIKAKVDTGARTSALHAFEIQEIERDGVRWVRFEVHPIQRDNHTMSVVEAPLVDERAIRNSGGNVSLRPVVELPVRIGKRSFTIEITLVRRDEMGFRMLLGRQAVRRRFVVDPGRSFLTGNRPVEASRGPSKDEADDGDADGSKRRPSVKKPSARTKKTAAKSRRAKAATDPQAKAPAKKKTKPAVDKKAKKGSAKAGKPKVPTTRKKKTSSKKKAKASKTIEKSKSSTAAKKKKTSSKSPDKSKGKKVVKKQGDPLRKATGKKRSKKAAKEKPAP